MIDHSYDLSQDLVASVIKLCEHILCNITMPKSDLDMYLSLGGFCFRVIQLRYKGRTARSDYSSLIFVYSEHV
jgi:hypothetical protein